MIFGFVRFAALSVYMVAIVVSGAGAQENDRGTLLNSVRTGQAIAMMRHALAPGTGDPSVFDVNDCGTQRNLSEEGRTQAAEIGQMLRENGIMEARVMTSAWCRCRDTAALLDLGPVDVLPALNSFFERRERGSAQTSELKEWLSNQDGSVPLVLVTHQVNITALTGVFPRSGEIVVFRIDGDTVEVLGAVPPAS